MLHLHPGINHRRKPKWAALSLWIDLNKDIDLNSLIFEIDPKVMEPKDRIAFDCNLTDVELSYQFEDGYFAYRRNVQDYPDNLLCEYWFKVSHEIEQVLNSELSRQLEEYNDSGWTTCKISDNNVLPQETLDKVYKEFRSRVEGIAEEIRNNWKENSYE